MTEAPDGLTHKLAMPAGAQPLRVSWIDTTGIVGIHLLAALAFLPWLFSWTGVVLAFAGLYVFGTIGIGLCYHRLLTHRGFICSRRLEHFFAVLGVCCVQDTPARWVATHRRHHAHADEQMDPHSPWVNFLWGHMGWLMFRNRDLLRLSLCERYAKDLLRDPFYARLEGKTLWLQILFGSWALYFAAGFGIELLLGGTALEALQFALSVLVWGVFVRTVMVWHVTWSVNSVSHLWGYRNYETGESSRNNLVVGIIASGEGWHNNHHAFPRSARHGHKWWELDLTWLTIRLLELLGLATKVVTPGTHRTVRPLPVIIPPVKPKPL